MSLAIVFVRFDDSEYTMFVLFTAFNKEPFLTSKNRQPLSFEQTAGHTVNVINDEHILIQLCCFAASLLRARKALAVYCTFS